MTVLWIIHRDPRMRAAIATLAGAGDDTVLGAPGDPLFDAAPPADVVLLGLAELHGDFEAELQFAHHSAPRLRRAAWVLLPDAEDAKDVRHLFDSIDAEILHYPPDFRTLRWRLRSAPSRRVRHPLPLSQRPVRDALTERFALWFADLDLPVVSRAVDPRMDETPVLIRGEAGTGRGLMVRYIHAFGGASEGALIRVTCTATTDIAQITSAISSRSKTERARAACTIWLEDVDELDPTAQREMQDWIEFAPPEGVVHTYRLRWIGSVRDESQLDAALGTALAGLLVDIPPLRERSRLITPFSNEIARTWCEARAERPRRFDDEAVTALNEHSWPANLRELEAVVVHSLSASTANPLRRADLRYGAALFAAWAASEPSTEVTEREEPPLRTALREEDREGVPIALAEPVEEFGATPVLESVDAEDNTALIVESDTQPRERVDSSLVASLRLLADAIAHEVGNPLSSIRTFAQLLPSHFEDEEFRVQFSKVVNRDVERAAGVAERLGEFVALGEPSREPVDATGLLEQLLETRRSRIRERRLLVLAELDHDRPLVFGDPAHLRFAFETVLDQALDLLPEHGEIFLASKHHERRELQEGGSSMRILLRCGEAISEGGDDSALRHSLGLVLAEWVVSAQGGHFAIDATESGQLVILLDLTAPEP